MEIKVDYITGDDEQKSEKYNYIFSTIPLLINYVCQQIPSGSTIIKIYDDNNVYFENIPISSQKEDN